MAASGWSRPRSAGRAGCGRSGRGTASPSAAIGKVPRRFAAWPTWEARAEIAPHRPFPDHTNKSDMRTLLSPRFPGYLLGLLTVVAVAVAGCSGGVKKVTFHGTVSYK